MTRFTGFGRLLIASLAFGGSAALAVPQQDTPHARQNPRDAQQRNVNFVLYSDLDGLAVTNPNGDEIGSIDDVIVERGSGQCKFYILKSGDWLGLGGRLTAIPADVFGWDSAKNRPVLDATREQITMLPEFSSDKWDGLTRPASTWDQLAQALAIDSSDKRDPYLEGDGSLAPFDLEGNITSVERRGNAVTGEEIVIHVASKNEQARNASIVLGPSWYIMSQAHAPMRGYTFEGRVVELPRSNGSPSYLAISAEINGEELALRDEETNEPLWKIDNKRKNQNDRDRADSSSVRAPYALLSDISSAEVHCRGEECGAVSDIIIDQPSGAVAFLVIDPDENFLGIADTNRLVPFNAVHAGHDGIVRIDASKQMVLNSRALPENVNDLEQRAAYHTIYKAYELEAPKFEPLKRREWNEVLSLGGWATSSEFSKAVADADEMQIEGTIVRIERKEPVQGMSRATLIVLNTEQGMQNVILGPSWYVDRQEMQLRTGDDVSMTVRHATVNGQPVIVACRVNGDEERAIEFWNENKPAWDRR